MTNPTLEILADDSALIVNGDRRFEISGDGARAIVAAYRHLLTHEGTGGADAALYVWGLVDGIRYDMLARVAEVAERARERRLDPMRIPFNRRDL